jgi:hypothetical protein
MQRNKVLKRILTSVFGFSSDPEDPTDPSLVVVSSSEQEVDGQQEDPRQSTASSHEITNSQECSSDDDDDDDDNVLNIAARNSNIDDTSGRYSETVPGMCNKQDDIYKFTHTHSNGLEISSHPLTRQNGEHDVQHHLSMDSNDCTSHRL